MTLRIFFLSCLAAFAGPPVELLERIDALEEKTFGDEKEARRFENEGFVPLWDKLLATPRGQRLDVLSKVPFETLTLGKLYRELRQDLGIQIGELIPGGTTLTPDGWREWLARYQRNGLEITHSDWHHDSFHRDEEGRAHSEIRFTIHLERNKGLDRTEVKTVIEVLWDESGEQLKAKTITMATRIFMWATATFPESPPVITVPISGAATSIFFVTNYRWSTGCCLRSPCDQ